MSALEGRWRRVTDPDPPPGAESVSFGHDPRMFPAEIEFSGHRYAARKAPDQGFIVWDAGSYTVDGDRLTLSLANDALASYSLEIAPDTLVITGETGRPIVYQRAD
ncbi:MULTISPECIES: hypothetical protein [unclassified Amycolatopsis]|uniref:hypothetical protein n=1 Tax=unclassified Amycolatopsis TaxID=2618356 RepID=UPI001A8C8753|nr:MULTISPECIES: hypothetical protein [unclassified Amycolatopsis]HET6705338.1 hypothetical protein [Amycolatopsis sp.]